MKQRIQIEAIEPKAYEGMFALENYLQQNGFPKSLLHLLKIRASQINGCAYCINMHTKEALNDGERQQRIFLLSAWKESNLFTEEEQMVLQLTEEITLIHQNGLTTATYQHALELFGEKVLAQVIMAIATINTWNRIAISTRMSLG